MMMGIKLGGNFGRYISAKSSARVFARPLCTRPLPSGESSRPTFNEFLGQFVVTGGLFFGFLYWIDCGGFRKDFEEQKANYQRIRQEAEELKVLLESKRQEVEKLKALFQSKRSFGRKAEHGSHDCN